jgi:hypothetical protein
MTNRFAPYPSQRKTTCSVQGCHIQLLASSLAKHVRDKHPEAHELAQQRKMKTQGTLMFARPEPVPSSSNAVPSTSTRPVFLRSHANIVHDDPVTEMHQDTTGLETDASTSTVPEHVIQVDDPDHIIDIPDPTPTQPLSQTFSLLRLVKSTVMAAQKPLHQGLGALNQTMNMMADKVADKVRFSA